MKNVINRFSHGLILLSSFFLLSCAQTSAQVPAHQFDLGQWKLTLPADDDHNGKVDEVNVSALMGFSHPDFFYLNDNGDLVFSAPNKAATTANSTNTRSELRQMLRGQDSNIKTHDPKNNFALGAHRDAGAFASVGGTLDATLKVLQQKIDTSTDGTAEFASGGPRVSSPHTFKLFYIQLQFFFFKMVF